MYSPLVTKKRIAEVEKVLGRSLPLATPEEAQFYVEHFRSLWDQEQGCVSALLRPDGLLPDEVAWVQKEHVLCMLDFRYFVTRYCFIRNMFGQRQLFFPNIGQRIVLDVWADLEEKEIGILMQALKARQLGISTITELAVCHRATFYPVNCVVASSDPEKSAKMAKMMEYVWEGLPWFLLPAQKPWKQARDAKDVKYRSGELVEFPQIGSAISIQWGNQTTGICRGTTPTVAHLSELCDFDGPEELVDASLVRAMHEHPEMFMVFESTAKGRDNWWYKTWQINKKGWPGRGARQYPLFLPWYVGTDLYPTRSFLNKNPVPLDWVASDATERHADKACGFVAHSPLLRKYLGAGWEMPREQQWFYETNRKEYQEKGSLKDWFTEMPADDMECFQVSGSSIFDPELIAEHRDSCETPEGVFTVVGSEAPSALRSLMLERDKEMPSIPIVGDYKLVPLITDNYPTVNEDGKVLLWEWPKENEEYVLGVDTAEGIGQDRTVVEVVRKGTPLAHAAQVCEFASDKVNAFELWPIVWTLANLYSTRVNGEYKQAKVVVECAANGEVCQQELKKRGWRNFHVRIKPGRKTYDLGAERLIGWKTDSLSRPVMLDFLCMGLKERWLQVNSPWFVDEMDDLTLSQTRRRIEARDGKHDDRIMALAMALYSAHWSAVYRSATPAFVERQQAEAFGRRYPVWTPGVQETGFSDRPLEYFVKENQ